MCVCVWPFVVELFSGSGYKWRITPKKGFKGDEQFFIKDEPCNSKGEDIHTKICPFSMLVSAHLLFVFDK